MRDLFFTELGKKSAEIRAIEASGDAAAKEAGEALLGETLEKFLRLSELGRKEGLLALEEEANEMKKEPANPGERYLAS